MNKRFTPFFLIIATIAIAIAMAGTAAALTGSASITLTCTGVIDNGSLFTADRDNTGSNQEAYNFTVQDGAGTVIHSFTSSVAVGFVGPIGNFSYNGPAPQFNPLTLRFTSLAGNGLEEQIVFTAEGNCPGLPVGCQPIPADSVVGRLTRTAQIFYEPGNVSPGLFLEAGKAFWVIGFDETREYAKIVLSCQHLWVEADAIGPNFDAPWFGAPLPDRVVN
mgnify:CR=1 FL=1